MSQAGLRCDSPGGPWGGTGAEVRPAALPLDLVDRMVDFCRVLRSEGFLATTSHSADAVRALGVVPLVDKVQVRLALRCVLAARPEEFAVFDEIFERSFALPGPLRAPGADGPKPGPPGEQEPKQQGPPSLSRWLKQGEAQPEGDQEPEEMPFASPEASLGKKDFSGFTADELQEIERIAARLARRLAARPGRRWKAARRGPRLDLRRTVRRALSTSFEPLDLWRRRRRPRKTRIVALCDVSGSMDLYSRFLLQFLYALQGSVARVESFVFSTSLRRVTEDLRIRPWSDALRSLAEEADGWSGGTRIGECLAAFARDHGELVDRRTVLVVLSDGWDTGDAEELGAVLEGLQARARRLVWLNPLLGSPGYQPLTAGMQAALPHVDVFAPAHNLDSLRALERHLLV